MKVLKFRHSVTEFQYGFSTGLDIQNMFNTEEIALDIWYLGEMFMMYYLQEIHFNGDQLIKRQSCYHIENSQLICRANQLTGFYMMTILAFNESGNREDPAIMYGRRYLDDMTYGILATFRRTK